MGASKGQDNPPRNLRRLRRKGRSAAYFECDMEVCPFCGGQLLSCSSDSKWRVFESVHISTHIIYAALTEQALNPVVECASDLLSDEGLSITFKFGRKRSVEHIQSLSELPSYRPGGGHRSHCHGRRAAIYFKLHTSTTFGKGAPGSSQTTMVELEVVAVPPLGRRITGEELGLDEED
jgi:hypothetical protein